VEGAAFVVSRVIDGKDLHGIGEAADGFVVGEGDKMTSACEGGGVFVAAGVRWNGPRWVGGVAAEAEEEEDE